MNDIIYGYYNYKSALFYHLSTNIYVTKFNKTLLSSMESVNEILDSELADIG